MKKSITLHLRILSLLFFGLVLGAVVAKAQEELNDFGYPVTVFIDGPLESWMGNPQDFKIPEDPLYDYIEFELRGADGGRAFSTYCYTHGGNGATVKFVLPIGDGTNQVPAGSMLRFIVGRRGSDMTSTIGKPSCSGGGGGTAIFLKEGGSFNKLLAVAGGGGGAYSSSDLLGCAEFSFGQGGRASENGGDGQYSDGGAGGTNGNGGKYGGDEYSGFGGGGYLSSGEFLPSGRAGYITGGEGGQSIYGFEKYGGWGCGGGGSGVALENEFGLGFGGGGGGGGGYSGGGGGGDEGFGGGGGSYLHPTLVLGGVKTNGGSDLVVETGSITYRFRCFPQFSSNVTVLQDALCHGSEVIQLTADPGQNHPGLYCEEEISYKCTTTGEVNTDGIFGYGEPLLPGQTYEFEVYFIDEVTDTYQYTVSSDVDTEAPILLCTTTPVTFDLSQSPSITIAASALVSLVGDACDYNLTFNNGETTKTITCADLDLNYLTIKAEDQNNNSSTCSANITVLGDYPNQVNVDEITVYLDENGTATLSDDDLFFGNPTPTHCSSGEIISNYSLPADYLELDCDDVGVHYVTLDEVDPGFPDVVLELTVVDDIPASVSVLPLTLSLDDNGIATLSNDNLTFIASDNCYTTQQIISAYSVPAEYNLLDCDDVGVNYISLDHAPAFPNVLLELTVNVSATDFPPITTNFCSLIPFDLTSLEDQITTASGTFQYFDFSERLYVPNYGAGTVSVINLVDNTELTTIPVGSQPIGVTVSPDNAKVYITNYGSNSVSVIDVATNTVEATIGVGINPWHLALNAVGTRLYVSNNGSGTLSTINTTTNAVIGTTTVGAQPIGVAVSPDGSKVFVANSGSNTVSVVNTNNNNVNTIPVEDSPTSIALNASGTQVYVSNKWGSASTPGSISIISVNTETVINTIPTLSQQVTDLAVSPNGKIYTAHDASEDGVINVIDPGNDYAVSKIIIEDGIFNNLNGISVNSDGTKVYVSDHSNDKVIILETNTNLPIETVSVGATPFFYGSFYQKTDMLISDPTSYQASQGDVVQVIFTGAGFACETASTTITFVQSIDNQATARTWTGAVSTNWEESCNWSPAGVPGNADNVYIPDAINNPLIGNSTNAFASSVTVQVNGQLDLLAGSSLTISGANGIGLRNFGNINNHGTLQIDHTEDEGISNESGATFINYGTLNIGLNGGAYNIGYNGILNEGVFENLEGLITIDNTNDIGLFNNQPAGTVFNNYATLNIGLNSQNNPLYFGIESWAPFNNNGGQVNIDNTNSNGLYAQTNVVTNSGTIRIGSNAATYSESDIAGLNVGSFGTLHNLECGLIELEKDLYNEGTLTNAGMLELNALELSTNTGTFNNDGVLQDLHGTISVDPNNGLIIAPVNVSSCAISDVLQIGSGNTYTALDEWFNDSDLTDKGGDYDQATNTFTPDQPLDGTYQLHFTVTNGTCTFEASIKLEGEVNPETSQGTYTWTGLVNTDWEASCNWSPVGIPGSTDIVYIPEATNNPIIGSSTAVSLKSLVIETGGYLMIENGGSLDVNDAEETNGITMASGAMLDNNGTIIIGNTAHNDRYGIRSAGILTNHADGLIRFVRLTTAYAGIYTEDGGVTYNYGVLEYDPGTQNDGYGFYNFGDFYNEAGGEIHIGRFNSYAIFNYTSGNFTNKGTLVIENSNTFEYYSASIDNWGDFTNTECGMVSVNHYLDSRGTITNEGYLYINTAEPHINTGTFTNDGVMNYAQEPLVSDVVNHEIIIAPTSSSNCVSVNPAFNLGAPVDFSIIGIFMDEAATQSAGTYDVATNTFVPSNPLSIANHLLYVQIQDENANCTRIATWNLTVVDCCTLYVTCYLDNDADQYGDPAFSQVFCETCGDGFVADNTDCDDNDRNEFPNQEWYPDLDDDGYPGGISIPACERPQGHKTADELISELTSDCNDNDPDIYTLQNWYEDQDDDNYYSGIYVVSCNAPDGYKSADELVNTTEIDCDDDDLSVNPAATEICDSLDNNCDGQIDEGEQNTYYADTDGDGFGDPDNSLMSCEVPAGYVTDNTDCDDNDANEFPEQAWYLDGDDDGYQGGVVVSSCERPVGYKTADELISITDTDCNDNDSEVYTVMTWYEDLDDDNYYSGTLVAGCNRPDGFKTADELVNTTDIDCDDGDTSINPAAMETCDGLDNNCDGQIDEGEQNTYYADTDGDGFGDPDNSLMSCEVPAGYVTDNTDCDDNDAKEFPGQGWYQDLDDDGYQGGLTLISCERPEGHKTADELINTTDTDCDDNDPEVYTFMTWYEDLDNDNYHSGTVVTGCNRPDGFKTADELVNTTDIDCNDNDANANPNPDCSGTTRTWTGAVDADWNSACNWSPNCVPGASDNVIIPDTDNDPVINNTTAAKQVTVETGAILTILSSGSLSMDNSDGSAIYNEGTVSNMGSIAIGFTIPVSGDGINNHGVFTNDGGTIDIRTTYQHGIRNTNGGAFNNQNGAVILIGTNGGEMSNHGILNNASGTIFTNSGSTIEIDQVNFDGFKNYQGAIFRNVDGSSLLIGQDLGGASIGMSNEFDDAQIINDGSTIRIDNCTTSKFYNRSFFENKNAALLVIGENGSAGNYGIFNVNGMADFYNLDCSVIRVYERILNKHGAYFQNDGLLTVHTAIPLENNSSFINNGIIEDVQGVMNIPTNNEIIIAPASGECNEVSPAFKLGATIDFNILGIFTDPDATQSAGTYDINTNTFVPASPDLMANVLYVEIEDPINGCTKVVSWMVDYGDDSPPVPDQATLSTLTYECSVSTNEIPTPTATDHCGGSIMATTADPLTYTEQGTYTITWTYDDGNGNSSQQSQTVVVDDQTAPEAVCQDVTITLEANGAATLEAQQVGINSTDNCQIANMDVDIWDFSCDDIGASQLVTLTVTDAGNNSASCSANVTVEKGTGLPSVWDHVDIHQANGDAFYDPCDELFTLTASGAGTPTVDQQHLAYRQICGDVELVAHIADISNGGWAGIQIREDLTPGSKMVGLKTGLSNFIHRDVRISTNGNRLSQIFFRPGAVWFKLVRLGTQFVGYTSPDGNNWQIVLVVNVPMESCVYAGIYVESFSGGAAVGVFDNFTVNGSESLSLNVDRDLQEASRKGDQVAYPFGGELPQTAAGEVVTADMSLFPNPVTDQVNVVLPAMDSVRGELSIVDMNGKEVYHQLYDLDGQQVKVDLRLLNLSGGLYQMVLRTSSEVITKRFVKTN